MNSLTITTEGGCALIPLKEYDEMKDKISLYNKLNTRDIVFMRDALLGNPKAGHITYKGLTLTIKPDDIKINRYFIEVTELLNDQGV
tara:strand:+ start:4609 stop:4869 length:261 start_codon:yes stop_codon:yes gene_type:complete